MKVYKNKNLINRKVLVILFLVFIICYKTYGEKEMKSHSEIFCTGVYWPWERTKWVAENSGLDFWKFVEEKIKELKNEFNCKIIWFVNISIEDASKVCDIAEKYGIYVFPCISPILHLAYHGIRNTDDIKKAVNETYKILGNKKSLGAYVLVDEPRRVMTKQMEIFRRALKEVDKNRESIVVTMNSDTESYAYQTNFPVLCVDIYPFGGDKSPNIPNPAISSQRYYRSVLNSLYKEAKKNGKKLWVMGQVFAENWGPWWYDENMNVVIEPGAYIHRRMPTIEETRWQIWEALRTGCKGVVFFVYLPCPNNWNGKGDIPEKLLKSSQTAINNKWPITKNQIKTNMAEALLYKNGSPTPQMKEMGRIFGIISKYEDLIFSFEPSDFPVVFVEEPFKTNTFLSSKDEKVRYVIIINDDLKETKEKKILFLPNVKSVYDILSKKEINLESEDNSDFLTTYLKLEPGSGTILKVEFYNECGFLVFKEDFSIATMGVETKNIIRRPIKRFWGTGFEWIIEKEKDAPPDTKGIITFRDILKPFPSPIGGFNILQNDIYIFIEGNHKKAESLIVEWVDKDGKKGWLMSNNYHLPCKIPSGTKDINIYIEDGVSINKILIWTIPKINKSKE